MNPDVGKQEARDVFAGVLLGTAVGDALGLPAENLSPGRIRRLWKGVKAVRSVKSHFTAQRAGHHAKCCGATRCQTQ